jgi:CubicO group peptidase (beta-lactamase class C family)
MPSADNYRLESTEPARVGIDAARLARAGAAITADVDAERYDGAALLVGRQGKVVLHEAYGFADRASGRRARTDDVYCIFSVTKTLTAGVVLAYIDRGQLSLTTPVADVIPEFGIKGKHRVTVAQLLSHSGGMSAGMPPGLSMELAGNLEATVAAICNQPLEGLPGETVNYSAVTAHAILAEMVRRVDGGRRRFREILAQELLEPLGMQDTALGVRRDLALRRVPIIVRDRTPGLFDAELLEAFNDLVDEDAEIPAGGAYATVADLFRWAETLRAGGKLGTARVLSPAIIALATTNHTGLRPNNLWNYARELRGWPDFPAYIGLSFFLRGSGIFPTHFGQTAAPGTFGGIGAGSALFWVDPTRDLTFVCLTAGLLEESRSFERFQRLSDLVLASVVN